MDDDEMNHTSTPPFFIFLLITEHAAKKLSGIISCQITKMKAFSRSFPAQAKTLCAWASRRCTTIDLLFVLRAHWDTSWHMSADITTQKNEFVTSPTMFGVYLNVKRDLVHTVVKKLKSNLTKKWQFLSFLHRLAHESGNRYVLTRLLK